MTAFFFYFKIIVVIEMKKKLINPLKIGKNLKRCVDQMGYKVKDIQEYLCLECPQPIYRWFKGSTYPSIHHLYALRLVTIFTTHIHVHGSLHQVRIEYYILSRKW